MKVLKVLLVMTLAGMISIGLNGCGGPDLPPHTVAADTSLAPKNGRRIQLNSNTEQLTRDECAALINGYRRRAGPDGQVSVHKPSRLLQGNMAPWCVENFDGRGIVFNDNMF